jgi:hypothetical protein
METKISYPDWMTDHDSDEMEMCLCQGCNADLHLEMVWELDNIEPPF